MSTTPGATTCPSASMTSSASRPMSPIAAIFPSRIPTSARRRGAPVPSTTSPPSIRTSKSLTRSSGDLDAVQLDRVVAEHASLRALVEADERVSQTGPRLGVQARGVRVVGLDHHVPHADVLEELLRRDVLEPVRHPDVVLEVLLR